MKKFAISLILYFVSFCVFAQNQNPLALTQGLNNFAFKIYKELTLNKDVNLIFSPYSVSSLFVIISQGANNNTYKQISSVFNLPEKQDTIFSELDQINRSIQVTATCESRIKCLSKKIARSLHVSKREGLFVGNSIWMQKNLPLDMSFLEKVKQISGVELYQVDFKNNPEQSRVKLNNWVEQKTNGLIENLFFPGTIFSSTKMVLANAIYFKASWDNEFKERETQSAPFKLSDSRSVTVKMMQQNELFPYFEDKSMQLAILPYKNSQLAMAVLLPKMNYDIEQLSQTLDHNQFDKIINQAFSRRLEVYLPKFNIASAFYSLREALESLGIKDAFTDRADFSRISPDFLSISDVIQKVVIDVDEKGTTAAAASATMMYGTAMPTKPLIFKADHPFIFVIFERDTHIILFMGQVKNPNL